MPNQIVLEIIKDSRLKSNDLRLLLLISSLAKENQPIDCTIKHLSETLDVGRSTIKRSINHLKQLGYLRVEQRTGYSNTIACDLGWFKNEPGGGSKMNRVKTPPTYIGTNSNILSNKKEKRVKKERKQMTPFSGEKGTRSFSSSSSKKILSEGWDLSETLTSWTSSRFPEASTKQLSTEKEAFKAFNISRGSKMTNWDAAWQSWCLKPYCELSKEEEKEIDYDKALSKFHEYENQREGVSQ